ncbi:periplasmic heavy metal sensor [bacterium]|nr:periplasmic heavy metal sensor [bacterium]
MRKIWILILLVSLGLNVGLGVRVLRGGGPLREEFGPGRRGDGPGWEQGAGADSTAWRRIMDRRLGHLARRLDLSPAQVEAFREAQADLDGRLRRARRNLFAARLRVRELMITGPVDRPALRDAMAEVGRRQAEMDSLATETLLRELEALEPGQREAYLDFIPRGGGRGAGRGGGPGHPDGGHPGR